MKRIGLLLAAVLTLALWPGVGTAFAGGGLQLVGGGGQDNSAIVVQNVATATSASRSRSEEANGDLSYRACRRKYQPGASSGPTTVTAWPLRASSSAC